jgi:nucleotide-binding universal stress UspA family protein
MRSLLDRVVCGVDRSDAGLVAAAAAARLTADAGELTLVTVHDAGLDVGAGFALPEDDEATGAADAAALARAAAAAGRPVESRLLAGDPFHTLLAEIERCDASLVVVGTHDRSRAVGIALGSVSTHVLHDAPCSVLVAREVDPSAWPRAIVAGVDGSPESAAAAAAARVVADRTGASLRVVVAAGDPHADVEAAALQAPDVERLPGRALDELHDLSEAADLLVVGSRRLRGLHSLRSVSERIAHEARCSVLVAR